MSHARCCCSGSGGNTSCPPTCLHVSFAGIQQQLSDSCYDSGGVVGIFPTPINGTYRLEAVSPGSSVFEGRWAIAFADKISSGGGDPPPDDIRVGGTLVIQVGIITCSGNQTTHVTRVSAHIEDCYAYATNPYGEGGKTPGPEVFSYNALTPVDTDVDSELPVQCGFTTPFGGGKARVTQPEECTLPPVFVYAEKCGDPNTKITIDPASRPHPSLGIIRSVKLGSDYYRPTTERSSDPEAAGYTWSDMDCPASEMNRLGRNCGDYGDLVAFDPSTRPGNGITFLYGGNRYVPTSLETSDAANTVTWSNLDCTGSPANSGNICADLIFNDPRCVDPIFDECPQCSSFLRSGSGSHGSDAMLDAMGFDPDAETRRAKQGGCCGQPAMED